MRYDRGITVILPSQAVGKTVWTPTAFGWLPGVITSVYEDAKGLPWATVQCDGIDGAGSASPLWKLRVRNPRLDGADKPFEPVPPTAGKPKAKAHEVRMGILSNGDVHGP